MAQAVYSLEHSWLAFFTELETKRNSVVKEKIRVYDFKEGLRHALLALAQKSISL